MLRDYLFEIYKDHKTEDIEKCLVNTQTQYPSLTTKQILEAITNITLYSGTSGYLYEWWLEKNVPTGFYPSNVPKRKLLNEYTKYFSFVEINGTFYKLPTEKAVKEWYTTTPDNFRFSVKMSKFATHSKKLADFKEHLAVFWNLVKHLEDKLLAILIQLPPNFKYSNKKGIDGKTMFERVKEAVKITKSYKCDFYFEFRDISWFSGEGLAKLESLFSGKSKCSMVFVNSISGLGNLESGWSPGLDKIGKVGSKAYFRLHGIKYKGLYSKGTLTHAFNEAKTKVNTIVFAFDNTDSLTNVNSRALPDAVINAMMID